MTASYLIYALKIKIESIQERAARNYGPSIQPRRNKWARVKNSTSHICLLINGEDLESGNKVFFWTPNTEIMKATGMLNYESIVHNGGNWFMQSEGEMIGHKSCFEGDRDLPVIIQDTKKIIPAVSEGDIVEISAKIKYAAKNGAIRLTHVHLLASDEEGDPFQEIDECNDGEHDWRFESGGDSISIPIIGRLKISFPGFPLLLR